MNLPNKLTIARVIAVPFFIAAYLTGWYLPAFVIFILASLTDMLVAASEGIVIAAGMSGKIKTVLQMIAVPMLLLIPAFPDFMPLCWAAKLFLWASLVMTVYSGVEYVLKNKNVFSM